MLTGKGHEDSWNDLRAARSDGSQRHPARKQLNPHSTARPTVGTWGRGFSHDGWVTLYRITLIVEAENDQDAEGLHGRVAHVACPHPPESEHRCPRGWMTMLARLDDDEAAEWANDLNR